MALTPLLDHHDDIHEAVRVRVCEVEGQVRKCESALGDGRAEAKTLQEEYVGYDMI